MVMSCYIFAGCLFIWSYENTRPLVFKIKCLFLQPDYGTDKNII